MTRPKFYLITLCMLLPLMALSACSKTVQWEEEVLLNTGETIWVKRTVVYSAQGGAGNPLDIRYRPSRDDKIEFFWRGKNYLYNDAGGVKVLAISPHGLPILVMNADAGAWDATTGYKCTIPFYVQFMPDASGKIWTWPTRIESWLYNLPTNLLLDIPNPDKMRPRYTHKEKMTQTFWRDPMSKFMQRIDPDYTGDLCNKKEK